jgi:hypothetical protein
MLEQLALDFPISCHGVGLSIGAPQPLNTAHLKRLVKLLDWLQPAVFSEHLAWSTHGDIFYNDLLPMLALLILAAQITALSHTAPQYPTWLGCRAGLIAGALATIIYAFYCTEDSPAFYGLWYAFGIILTAGIGAASGRIFLRW